MSKTEIITTEPAQLQVFNMSTLDKTIQSAKDIRAAFDRIQKEVLGPDDFQEFEQLQKINGRWEKTVQKFVKKSGCCAMAQIFGISTKVTSVDRKTTDEGYVYVVTVEASASWGSNVTCVGACSWDNFKNKDGKISIKNEAHIAAFAETRATNRAILKKCGIGAVSAEEIDVSEYKVEKDEGTGFNPQQPYAQAKKEIENTGWIPDKYREGVEFCTNPNDPMYQNALLAISEQKAAGGDGLVFMSDGFGYSEYLYRGVQCIQRKKKLEV